MTLLARRKSLMHSMFPSRAAVSSPSCPSYANFSGQVRCRAKTSWTAASTSSDRMVLVPAGLPPFFTTGSPHAAGRFMQDL
eukprot:8538498-Pyramimonas_sp.AAC.1